MCIAKITILLPGYYEEMSQNRCRASSTIILVQNEHNILVDTGNPQDAERIIATLKEKELTPDDINIVVNTHFHPDHTGCNYLFKKARFVVPGVAFWDDLFDRNPETQALGREVELIPTPGHSEDSCTLLVTTEKGLYACVGDLFWKEHDETIPLLEEDCSDKELFYKNREKILGLADWIVPGHGEPFQVKKE